MKNFYLSLLTLSVSLISVAQNNPSVGNYSTNFTTIDDIVKEQELVSQQKSNIDHFYNVWGYKSYFDIAYNTSKLTPQDDVKLGYKYNGGIAPIFKSDWGMSIQFGHNYGLHKPIAGILKFNIDWSILDFNINHYKTEKGTKLFDSNAINNTNGNNKYIPWCMEKYDYNLGMAIGPSITIAPFTHLGSSQLHFLRFNIYYHIGYHFSFMKIDYNEKHDVNPPTDNKTKISSVLNMGHGITNSFGLKMSWKSIGFGYEIRSGKLGYTTFQKEIFGDQTYKFKDRTNRIFLEIRF